MLDKEVEAMLEQGLKELQTEMDRFVDDGGGFWHTEDREGNVLSFGHSEPAATVGEKQ